MSFLKKIIRRVKKSNTKRRVRNRAAIAQAKRAVGAQARVQKESRRTAEEVMADGGFEWEGSGLDPKTLMEPVMGDKGWEWHPVQKKPRKTAASGNFQAEVCGAKTKDGTPCQRRGKCPIPSHRKK